MSRRAPNARRGALFLVGGKDGRSEGRDLIARFARLCGRSPRVLVLTAASLKPERHRKEYTEAFLSCGARDVAIFHVEDRAAAEDRELLSALDRADGVYFSGGSQRRLIDAMGRTKFDKRLRARHRKGLHVGGTSAGASAASEIMIAETEGGAPVLSTGFGLLKEIIVDQHFRQRDRLSRLIDAVRRHPRMLGFGLDEGTAVEIDASGRAVVFGAGALTVVDGADLLRRGTAFAGMRLHVLTAGWRYDLVRREADRKVSR